jgi:cobyric acid synthase CobQ
MFVGTGSDVGKSIIASAFCRIFLQDGYHPAPFKAQNMSLNSYATPEGLEIGRAQAVQAEAAGIPCHTDMNPLLLKPSSDKICQVVLNGKPIGNQDAYEYFREEGRDELRREVYRAFDRLQKEYNPIVMEGAGSISEINLRHSDLVNMSMAMYAGAATILVADIDRGGVFASVYGSILLLSEEERKHIKGILINKFRGDIRLFESGVKTLEQLCGIPVLGVVPYYEDIYIEEEDSVTLQSKNLQSTEGKINIAVVLLRRLSNFTDFNVLERDSRVHLYYTNNTDEIEKADIVIIPGSKSTISDLYELRKNGVAQSIIRAVKNNKTVIGICGGFQMMGQDICDPNHIESDIERLPGLGLLPITTQIEKEKITRQVRFSFEPDRLNQVEVDAPSQVRTPDSSEICEGYEIHMGITRAIEPAEMIPLNKLQDGSNDGFFLHSQCFGSYIHGILDNPAVIEYILAPYKRKSSEKQLSGKAFKEEQYDKLADHVRDHVNMELIYKIMAEKE